MDKRLRRPARLEGEVVPPGDKSISHRAAIFNAIAQGKARVGNFLPAADCLSTLACLQALGVLLEWKPGPPPLLEIGGVGMSGLKEPEDVLDAGNSGTTLRLLTGLLAAQPFLSVITGDASLRSRPMGRIIQPLRLMGGEVWGRGDDSLAPLVIRGQCLQGITYHLPVASAQVKSALLLAGLFAQGNTVLMEPAPSRDHTERLLQAMGASLVREGTSVTISPATSLRPLNMNIPGDISSASAWLVAAAIHPQARVRVKDTGINPTRTGVLDILKAMGASLRVESQRWEGGEPIADITMESSRLEAVEIGGKIIPRLIDEIPLLAVAACFARGTTTIRDASELRVKESDRISTTAQELSRLGARVEELPDGLVIHGEGRLKGAEVDSHGDHRLAMTLAVAALMAEGETVIHGAEAVDISYRTFWQDLESLAQG